jgi:hypothetical protein
MNPNMYFLKESHRPGTSGYNSSYSGGRGQEECISKPALEYYSWDPILKKTHHNKKEAGEVAQGVGWIQTPVPQKKSQSVQDTKVIDPFN